MSFILVRVGNYDVFISCINGLFWGGMLIRVCCVDVLIEEF